MITGRSAVAGLVAVAICASLEVATWKPLTVQAIATPGIITTFAGGAGSGTATAIAQAPWGLALSGTTLYIADSDHSVVRALNIGTGAETIVAGNGTSGPDDGDGGQATAAVLNLPGPLALDSAGNLFVGTFNKVRRIDHSTGIITTVVGQSPGSSLAGVLATVAPTNRPGGLAVDSLDNLYVSDHFNVVRKVDRSTGIITIVAGTAFPGFTGDGGPATSAELSSPEGISFDGSGNLWVADLVNNRIREIVGGTINTIAGDGVNGFGGDGGAATLAHLSQPRGVEVDGSGNVWIADSLNARIREVVGGIINTVAGNGTVGSTGDGGPATSAELYWPFQPILDGSGNLFISDQGGKRVREVSAGTITTVGGNGFVCSRSGDGGAATAATLCSPSGVAVDGTGDLFVADQLNSVVREINAGGTISTLAGDGTQGSTGDTGAAVSAQLDQPRAVAVNGSGDVFIADTENNVVRKVSGGIITRFAGNYTAGFAGDGGAANVAELSGPTGLAIDGSGNLYIADDNNVRIRKVTPGGVISTYAGSGSFGNSGDGGPATSATLESPQGVAIDGLGNLYISDTSNSNIRKVDSGGTISTVATGFVRQLAAGPGNRIFTASDQTNQVSLLTPGGLVPLAGTGAVGGAGDGGPARGAELYYPSGVAVDSAGNIFIGDFHNNKIRRVQAYQLPSVPGSVSAAPGMYSANVKWSAPPSGGLPITSYTVTPSLGPPVTVTGSPPPLSATISGLDTATSYTFTVSARTAWGSSAASSPTNAVTPLVVPKGEINTNAGSVGFGPAISLGQAPYAVAVAGSHLLVGDLANPVVRDVNIGSGQETVLAGNDSYGYSGNGGQAASAMIVGATAVAACNGDTYIADGFNYVIRRINSSNVITTVAGTGKPGFSGDGGPAKSAQIGLVLGLACRSGGGLYISDTDNGRIRILDSSGNIDTWWFNIRAPTGIVELGSLDDVAMSESGSNRVWNLTDFAANLIAGTGVAGYSGDGGAATSAKLNDPRGLTWFGGSLLYIADRANSRIRQVSGSTINTVAGTGSAGFSGDLGPATSAQLNNPTDVNTADGVTFFVADSGNLRVRKFSVGSTITTVAGNGTPSLSGNGGQATAAQLGNPFAIAFDAAGNEYIADNQNSVIRKVTTSGVISTVAGTGVSGYAGDGGLATAAKLSFPQGVAVNAAGDIFISDAGNLVIRKVDHSTGNITTVASGLSSPTALVVDGGGNLYIADTDNNRVMKLTPGGTIGLFAGTGVAGYSGDGGAATSEQLNSPRGLAIDASGNVAIADTLNYRVRQVASGTGFMTTIAGNGLRGLAGDLHLATVAELASPHGLAFDPAGNLYIADTGNERIRAVDTHGIIRSAIGVCGIVAAFSGDGGPADLAHVNTPFGVATDALGNLFIAEVNSNRVRVAALVPGARNSSCPGKGGNPSTRGVTAGPGGVSPGVRVSQTGPPWWVPMPSKAPSGTLTAPIRSTHVFPARRSAAHGALHPQASGSSKALPPWTGPVAGSGTKLAISTQPVSSHEQVSPWYALLLAPLALLVVALVIQWRRQRE